MISIHAPLAGCDLSLYLSSGLLPSFQSTHPLRGATSVTRVVPPVGRNFNPRTPCGVRQLVHASLGQAVDFNPRTPCGVRLYRSHGRNRDVYFNPRTPCGVRPDVFLRPGDGDKHFNPRTPCGVRQVTMSKKANLTEISIHAPLAGCDQGAVPVLRGGDISIHAPLAGCDNVQQHWRRPGNISIHAPLAGCDGSCKRSTMRD